MSELRDDLYQRLHGFKSVKRSHKKQGQSDWYYLDPRGASTVASMKQIDVADEYAINPQLDSIISDDMTKNPNDYYIWRTRKDDKVRGKHAEREGKIFNKHIPPEGGNPGEDYNCRCWGEPYKPEKVAGKPVSVDMSSLDMFKDVSPNNKNKALKKYAENDKVTKANDAGYKKYDNSILTEEKFRDIITFLRKNNIEGFTNYPYLDSVGKDTVCTGHLITKKEQYSLPYYMADTGKLATKVEIKKEFDKLHQYTEYQKNAKDKDVLRHTFFENVTKLRLTDVQCDMIDRKIIEAKWDELVEKFPNFTIMDWNLQRAIFDVHYQNNIIKKADKIDKNHPFGKYVWKNLWLSASNKDINGIANNVLIRDNNQFRNDAKIMFTLQGKFYE